MSRNEDRTCRELIEPALQADGWAWDRQLPLGRGAVNIADGFMYDPNQKLVLDYLPVYGGGQKLRGHLEQVKRRLYVAN